MVVAFAACGLLVPLAAVEDVPFGKELEFHRIIWAVTYGLPALIAAFVFGIANLRRRREVRSSVAGLVLGAATLVALPIIFLLR